MFVDHFPWQSIFVFSAALALLALVLTVWLLPTSPGVPREGPLDIMGGILFVPAVALLLLGISQARPWGWDDARTLAFLAGGALLLAVWARHELRQQNPLISVRLLLHRQTALANLTYLCAGVGPMAASMVTMLLLQQPTWTGSGLGASATFASLLKAPSNFVCAFAGLWGGYLAAQYGARRATVVGAAVLLFAWIALTGYHGSVWFVAGCVLIAQPALTIVFGAVPNLLIEVVPHDRTSEATGLAQVTRALGMAVGTQMLALLLATSTVTDAARGAGRFPTEAAYMLAFVTITVICAVLLVCALALPRTRTPGQVQPAPGSAVLVAR